MLIYSGNLGANNNNTHNEEEKELEIQPRIFEASCSCYLPEAFLWPSRSTRNLQNISTQTENVFLFNDKRKKRHEGDGNL